MGGGVGSLGGVMEAGAGLAGKEEIFGATSIVGSIPAEGTGRGGGAPPLTGGIGNIGTAVPA